jgi:hypothetical protein
VAAVIDSDSNARAVKAFASKISGINECISIKVKLCDESVFKAFEFSLEGVFDGEISSSPWQ